MPILVSSQTPDDSKNFWATSWAAFCDAETLYGREFAVDVCAEPATTKCHTFIGHPMLYEQTLDYRTGPEIRRLLRGLNCLALDTLMPSIQWPADWWCNPPFDLKLEYVAAARKAQRSGLNGMMLLPYEPLTIWWRDILEHDCIVYEPDGRYQFYERDGVTQKNGSNFGSVLVGFPSYHLRDSIRIPYRRGIYPPRQ